MIAEAAYYRAQRRGFDGGDPLADWVEAEAEVDAELQRHEHRNLLGRLEERLAEVGPKLSTLQEKVAATRSKGRAELQQELDRVAALRDTLERRLDELRAQGHHASRRVKEQAEELWEEISEAVSRIKVRRSATRRKQSS